MKNQWSSHFALFAVALIYGANYSIAKLLMDPGLIQPNAFILYRVLCSAILFVLFARTIIPFDKNDFPVLIICAVCGIIGNQLLFFNGLKLTSPVHAALIMVCTPILVILMQLFRGHSMNLRQWIGCLMGLAGTSYLIAFVNNTTDREACITGDLMVLGNASFYAYYLIRIPPMIKKYGSFPILKILFLISVIPVLIISLPQLGETQWNLFTTESWMAFGFVLIATTFFAYALNAYALTHSSPQLVSLYIYLQPLLGTFIAISLGKDHLVGGHILSAVLIFTGLYLSVIKNEKSEKKNHSRFYSMNMKEL